MATTTYHGLNINDFNLKYGHRAPTRAQSSITLMLKSLKCSRRGFFTALEQRIPAIKVLRKYEFQKDILGDIVSGLSVGVMTIPQSMGYALLADVPGYYGLYTSLFPVIIYFLFGTSRHVSIGTMALSSLVIRSAVEHAKLYGELQTNMASNGSNETDGLVHFDHPYSVHVAVSVSLTAGIFLLAMSFFRLGFIVTYMSDSFISGYLAASNILVLTHQVKLVLGVQVGQHAGAFEFFYLIYDIFRNIADTNLMQLLISVVSITCLILVKRCINERFKSKMKIPVPIDLVLVIVTIIICHFANLEQLFGVKVLKDIPRGIPVPVIPSPVLMYRYLFEGFMLAIVSYMMVAMMATLFAQRHQYKVDNNQELAANGLACIIGSFLNSLAASSSPPRCFLMESTGGRTQVSYLVSSCLVLITLMAIAPLFYSLPICVLASVVIVACIPLFVHYTMWLTYWRSDRYDFSIWVLTFWMTFIAGVDYGLVIGVGFSLVVVHFRMQHSPVVRLLPSSDGNMVILNSKSYSDVLSLKNVFIFQFNGPLYFATSSIFKQKLQAAVDSLNNEEGGLTSTELRNEQNVRYHSVASIQQHLGIEERELKVVDEPVDSGNGPLKPSVVDESVDSENGPLKPTQNSEILNSVPIVHKVVIVNCCGIPFMDTGGATTLAQLHQAYDKQSIRLVLACCNDDVLLKLKRVTQCQTLLSSSVFPSVQDALIAANLLVVHN